MFAWVERFLMNDFQWFLLLVTNIANISLFFSQSLLITLLCVFLDHSLEKLLPNLKVLHFPDFWLALFWFLQSLSFFLDDQTIIVF